MPLLYWSLASGPAVVLPYWWLSTDVQIKCSVSGLVLVVLGLAGLPTLAKPGREEAETSASLMVERMPCSFLCCTGVGWSWCRCWFVPVLGARGRWVMKVFAVRALLRVLVVGLVYLSCLLRGRPD